MNARIETASFAAVLLIGCGHELAPAPAAPSIDEDWQQLAALVWEVDAGGEELLCVRRTVERDGDIVAFHADMPEGSQRAVLTVGEPSGPDGVTACTPDEMNARMMYGTDAAEELALPPGIAVHVAAGEQLLLNLRLVNDTAYPVVGRTAVEVRYGDSARVTDHAQAVLMGPTGLVVPAGAHRHMGRCTLQQDAFLFALAPHGRRPTTHMEVLAHSSFCGEMVLHDAPIDIGGQAAALLETIVPMTAGDYVELRCDYQSDMPPAVGADQGLPEDSCVASVFRFPVAVDSSVACTE